MRALLTSLFDRKQARDDVEGTIRAWRREQMRPWRHRSFRTSDVEADFQAINATEPSLFLYRITGSRLRQEPKPEFPEVALHYGNLFCIRAAFYTSFFEEVVENYPVGQDGVFLAEMNDRTRLLLDAPIFAFQKRAGDRHLLVHDIDFLLERFDAGNRPADALEFHQKENRAVFSGSTTGLGNTLESARRLQNPRVAAMVFFKDRPDVDFRLPAIVQCNGPEAADALRAIGCGQDRMEWPEQFKAKYIISMDGNGATCSRVVKALSSNSILLKYASDWRLVYFQSLEPWRHFIPINKHEDVLAVLAAQRTRPDAYRDIAEQGKAFARALLTKDVALRYTSDLLRSYLSLFR